MRDAPPVSAISGHIWDTKYRFRDGNAIHDHSIEETWRRIARALASCEQDRTGWEQRFYGALEGFRFLPGGRIQAGAGTGRRVTLFNCFVMGLIDDSMDGIFDALKEGALTMQQGGGVGYDFSTLRPRGAPARSVGVAASGPVSFMTIWDAMCATLLSVGSRRGAMMATLRCDHPDIEDFIAAKREGGRLRHFNLSVLVSDAFMEAVRRDDEWSLVFPAASEELSEGGLAARAWSGTQGPVPCRVYRRLRARALWDTLMRATYESAEPGVLFVDRINDENNLAYRETISATNPCGELPLPPYGACDLGSINLTQFVREPFSAAASLDLAGVAAVAGLAVRMMDNAIDLSLFPLAKQAEQARGTRRIGLGLTGLADALIMLNLHYDSDAARSIAASVMKTITLAAYRASITLARDKGPFPFLDTAPHLRSPFVKRLPQDIREGIARSGIRNSHLTAIAPTGTISLLANNVSSGLEPVYDFVCTRRLLARDGSYETHELIDYAMAVWRQMRGAEPPPATFVRAHQLGPEAHLAMQAALQPHVDSAISKTINVRRECAFEDFKDIYRRAHELGLKGCTTFRPNPVTGEVLSAAAAAGEAAPHCCNLEREAD